MLAPGTPGDAWRGAATEAFLDALDLAGMQEQLSVVVIAAPSRRPERHPRQRRRRRHRGQRPRARRRQRAGPLYAAEDGSLSWHLAVDVPPTAAPDRGGERRTYRMPRAVVPVDEQDAGDARGVLGAIGKKVLKVLVFPLVDPVLGKVGDHFARKWEARTGSTACAG